jgi:hypothetical protein
MPLLKRKKMDYCILNNNYIYLNNKKDVIIFTS